MDEVASDQTLLEVSQDDVNQSLLEMILERDREIAMLRAALRKLHR